MNERRGVTLDAAQPFVLLDDARAEGAVAARLFRGPVNILTADTADDIPRLLDDLAAAERDGLYAAGYLHYEAGAAFEPSLDALQRPRDGTGPLGWFGLFTAMERIAADAVQSLLPDPGGAWASAPVPDISRDDYLTMVEAALAYIHAGDIYQANLTFAASVAWCGDPLALYARLRGAARAGYGGVVATGAETLLSFSPELFFSMRDAQVMARPMKGTAVRQGDAAADAAARAALAGDAKQRAENLMIVDLIRNDLSRVAVPGSVTVPDLFRVETYPTVHQMVSDVQAALLPAMGAADVLRAAYPCGSITGAPKLRAMAIIDELEHAPRGVYTGAIGYSAPGGEAAFNVAIRTLVIGDDREAAAGSARRARMGLGSGIVADSHPRAEWDECLAKGAFVTAAVAPFDLIETLAFDPMDGLLRLDAHLARLTASAATFGFAFDRHKLRNDLQLVTFRQKDRARVRIRLSRSGATAIVVGPMPPTPAEPVTAALMPLPVATRDFRLCHKTSDRAFYDEARWRSGAFEAVLIDPDGFVTEGSFTSIFVERDGVLITPPLEQGLLPGVLRSALIAEGRAVEGRLRPEDLRGGFWLGNSLRGLMAAVLQDA